MSSNQIVKHLLSQWKYLEDNMDYLTDLELGDMKILFASLKELKKHEVTFLAVQYRISPGDLEDNNKTYLRDALLAERSGMSLSDHTAIRVEIESKLKPIIIKYRDKFQSIAVPDKIGDQDKEFAPPLDIPHKLKNGVFIYEDIQ